jgi:hypothetical protein
MPKPFTKFGLRLLFLIVTAICCFLAYEGAWIRQRREARAILWSWNEGVRAPSLLWVFGENGFRRIMLKVREEETQSYNISPRRYIWATYPPLRRVQRLYPESVIFVVIPMEGSKGWRPVEIEYPNATKIRQAIYPDEETERRLDLWKREEISQQDTAATTP